jgi:hypothetical protein
MPYTFSTLGFAKNASVIKLTPKKATVSASPKERKMMAEMKKMQDMMKKMEEDNKKLAAGGGKAKGGGGAAREWGVPYQGPRDCLCTRVVDYGWPVVMRVRAVCMEGECQQQNETRRGRIHDQNGTLKR